MTSHAHASAHVHGSGPGLILAHGAGGSFEDNFTGLVGELEGRRTVLGVDYPGSGSRPVAEAPLQLDDLADELVETALTHGHERFPVLGLSLGSAVALTAALRHPTRVSALVLTVGFARRDAQLATFVEVYSELASHGQHEALAGLLALTSTPAAMASWDEGARATALEAMTEAQARSGLSREPQMTLGARVDLADRLGEIDVPTLVIVAGQDRIVLPSSTRALAHGITGAELVEMPQAGHIFTAAETLEWAAVTAAFLDRHGV